MRKLVAFFVLLALFCTSAIHIFAQDATQEAGVAPERPDLITLLQNDPDGRFTTLVAAIQASGAETVLDDAGPFTLLAPTNDAFDALFAQTGMTADQLLADRATLTKVLLYHVLPGQYFFRNLTSGPELPTSLLGQSVQFDLTGGVFTVNGANISDPDNLASNGVMIGIDAVLLPPDVAAAMMTPEPMAEATEAPTAEPTEVATPEVTVEAGVAPERPDLITLLQDDPDGRFTTLVAAIQASGAETVLDDAGPFTLLAPTNDAFTALFDQTGMTADQLLADRATLTKVLLYHVLPGQYFFRNLTSGPELPTSLLGQSVQFDLTGGVFTVNGANISDPDNLASNGVMIGIDAVLLPPDVAAAMMTPEPIAEATEAPTAAPTEVATPEATPVAVGVAPERPDLVTLLQDDPDGRFTTLVAAIDAAGLADSLQGGPFTLLAPTNDAFDALLAQTGMTADQLLADNATLTKVLLQHVLPGKYFFRNLTSGPTVDSLLAGSPVTFDLTGGVFTANGANISDPDNIASNGVMIGIDAVILPPDVAAALATPEPTPEPTEVVTPEATVEAGVAAERPDLLTLLQDDADGRFTTLVAAIQASGAETVLDDAGPFTLLAPTNDAFDALLAQTGMTADQLLADRATLTKILLYHVLPGQYFFRNLTSGPELPTSLLGESVQFDLTGGVFTVNGANISDPDNLASNGVMIGIDAVLLPPDVAAALPVAATPEPTAEPTEVAGGAHVRFVNFSPNASSVDLDMGAGGTQANLLFGNVTDWQDITPATYDISATADGSGATASTSVSIAENAWVTVAVTGSAADDQLLLTALVEDFSAVANGSARLSVFNGVEGSSSYDVALDGNTLVIRLGYPGTQGDNDGFYTVDVTAGTYKVQFLVHNSPSNVVINLPDVSLDAGMNYFISVAGSSAAPGAVIVASPIP